MSYLVLVLQFSAALFLAMHAIIIVHELGHLLMAKLSQTAVYEFHSGVGPVLLRFRSRNIRFEFRLFPLAGGVALVGANVLPQSVKSRRSLKEALFRLNPEHPGFQRETWFRKRPLLVRLAVILAGPFSSVTAGIVLFIVAAASDDTVVVFDRSAMPQDALCAAAVVCELELQDRGIEDGNLHLRFGNAAYTYPVQSLARFQEGSRLVEAYTPLKDFWESNPEGVVYFQHNQGPVLEMRFAEVIERHMLRLERQARELSGISENPGFSERLSNRTKHFFSTIEYAGDKRWGKNSLWRRTLVGRTLSDARVFWDAGFSDFLLYTAGLSILIGIFNMLPLFPLDGGRILSITLHAIGVRSQSKLRVYLALYGISVCLLLVLTLLLPLLHDLWRLCFG